MGKPLTSHHRWLFFIIVVTLLPLLLNLLGMDFSSQTHSASPLKNELLHALFEWSAVSITLITALVSCLHYLKVRDIVVPTIGLALLCVGVVDAFHTLASTHIITANAPNIDFIPFTWALSRTFNAVIMITGAFICLWFFHWSVNPADKFTNDPIILERLQQRGFKTLVLTGALFAVMAYLAIHLTLLSDTLPQTMYPDAFLTRPFDVLPLTLFLFGCTLFWVWYKQDKSTIKFALVLSSIPQITTQLYMTFGSQTLYDNDFNIAHGLKIIAYGCILIGLLISLVKEKQSVAITRAILNPTVDNHLSHEDNVTALKIGKANQPISIQLPIAAFILAVFVAMVVSFTFYFESEKLIKKQEINQLRIESALVEPLLEQLYRQSSSDLFFLSHTPPVQGLIKAININDSVDYMLWQGRLEQIFSEMLKSKAIYTNISYIGIADNGLELVSAVNNVGGVRTIPVSQRQTRANSRHFRNTIELNPGEIYFSTIELNRQHNKIMLPHQPVVQVSTPIYNPTSGKVFGTVVIHVDFGSFIEQLKTSALTDVNLYLANQNGDFLEHPDKRLNFGFDLGQRHLLQQNFPELASIVKQKLPSKGFSDLIDNQGNAHAAYYRVIDLTKYGSEHPLLLLLQPLRAGVNVELQSFRNRSLLIGISLSFIALALSVVASRRVAQPLMQMTNAVQEFEHSGQLPALPTHSTDEIGVLARSFHNLFIRINDSLRAQQRSARQVQESSDQLQAILNSAADAIITIDTDANIMSFNTAAETMFGYTEAEILNTSINALMPAGFADKHDGYIKKYLESHISNVIGVGRELTGRRKDQSIFAIHLAISEVTTARGKLFTGIIRDISFQKQAELQQSQSLSLLEAILESTDNGILVTDESGQTLRSNSRFAEMWCITDELVDRNNAQDLLEHILNQLIEPKQFAQNIESLYADTVTESFDMLHFKDSRVVERISRPMTVNGKSSGRVWSFRDITLTKQTEQTLIEAKEAAENITRYKSEFLASMSHEIRTPMNGVLGMLGLLSHSDMNKQQQHYCKLAHSSAESLLVIINDILDFSKFEAGKLELEIIDFDLHTQLGEFAESVGHRAQEKGLELILDLTKIKHSLVKGDPGRLRQILNNLVGNAIKFTEHGEIIVRASVVDANDDPDDDQLRLICSISDTGIGIDLDKQATLFDSFTQVDASTTREYGGTGLGLAIVKQLCELMGGSISVCSQTHQGSCFEFNILLQSSENSQQVMPHVNINGMAILIVDDNATNREVLRGQLAYWGAIVTEAADGPTALQRMKEQQHDPINPQFVAAFIDMQMPGMDGMALARAIRAESEYGSLKMVMMTSMSSRGDAQLFADAGFSAYFPKPTTTADLFDSLSVVIAGGVALSQAQPLVTRHYLNQLRSASANNTHPDDEPTTVAKIHFPPGIRLLLVEDNFINQTVTLAMLEKQGLPCDLANNGIEALDMLVKTAQVSTYQLVLMDCQMPEMDGYEATRQIRQGQGGEHYSDIIIIAMTANAMLGDKEKCLDVGMNDYISKPIDPQVFEDKLRLWLGGTVNT